MSGWLSTGLLLAAAAVAAPLWPGPAAVARRWRRWLDGSGRARWPLLAAYALPVVLAAAAALLALGADGEARRTGVVAAAVAAVVAGGPVTAAVLEVADRSPGTETQLRPAVLRGGAWIGALERLAVVATLMTRWPEGLAVVLGVKALARYPELRAPAPATAERFIIGTFGSVLWAAACAGVGHLLFVAR